VRVVYPIFYRKPDREEPVKVGATVSLIGIPPGLSDDDELQTRSLFEKCLGRSFRIVELETVEGLSYKLVKLNVGHMLGKSDYLDSIWVEPEYLEIETSPDEVDGP
jgi:hypothetical protein